MTYMPAKSLVNLSLGNQLLKQVSDDEMLWQALVGKDFNTKTPSNNYRIYYGDLVLQHKQYDEDLHIYRQGYDYLIEREYKMAWRRIPHFFAIPFKVTFSLSHHNMLIYL